MRRDQNALGGASERKEERRKREETRRDDHRTTEPIEPVYRDELTGQGCLVRRP